MTSNATEQVSASSFVRPPMQPYMSDPQFSHLQQGMPPHRRRYHSEAEVPLLFQAQQNAMHQHQQWTNATDVNGVRLPSFAELGASIDPRFMSVSPSVSPASVVSQALAQDEMLDPFGIQQPSLAGPSRRISNASEQGRPNWVYGEDISRPGSSYGYSESPPSFPLEHMDDNGLVYPATSSDQQLFYSQAMDAAATFAQNNMMPNQQQQLNYMPQFQDGNNFAYAPSGSESNYYAYPQDAFGHPLVLQNGTSSGCPSPTFSTASYEPRRYNSAGLTDDGGEVLANPVHLESQTTSATKQAAAARRKPGTEAKYVCEYCGESCVFSFQSSFQLLILEYTASRATTICEAIYELIMASNRSLVPNWAAARLSLVLTI
jgi:hypothetical protein